MSSLLELIIDNFVRGLEKDDQRYRAKEQLIRNLVSHVLENTLQARFPRTESQDLD